MIEKVVGNYFLLFLIIQKTGRDLKKLSISRFKVKNKKYFFHILHLKMVAFYFILKPELKLKQNKTQKAWIFCSHNAHQSTLRSFC